MAIKLVSMDRFSIVIFLLIAVLAACSPSQAAENLLFDKPQVAGISGFRAFWDVPIVLAKKGPVVETVRNPGGSGLNAVWAPEKREGGSKPGAIVFDAVHRSALVRFLGSAEQIAGMLRNGQAIEKVELLLTHRATEMWAEGYSERDRHGHWFDYQGDGQAEGYDQWP